MKKYTSGIGDGVSLSIGTLLGNMEGLPFQGLWRKYKFSGDGM